MNGGDGGEVATAPPAGPPPPLEWKFSQVFGERTAGEEVQEGKANIFKFFYFISQFLTRWIHSCFTYCISIRVWVSVSDLFMDR